MKTLVLCSLLLLTGCAFLTGKKVTTVDPVTGETKTTYEPAPIEDWVGLVSFLVPGLALGAGAATRIAVKAARAKEAFLDANAKAIADMDAKGLLTVDNAKLALKTAQDMHHESKLLADEFKKWKAKKALKG